MHAHRHACTQACVQADTDGLKMSVYASSLPCPCDCPGIIGLVSEACVVNDAIIVRVPPQGVLHHNLNITTPNIAGHSLTGQHQR